MQDSAQTIITILQVIDTIIFLAIVVNALYLIVFTVASFFTPRTGAAPAAAKKKIAILIPAYKEDNVIAESVASCMEQNYPSELFTTVVISDRMRDETNDMLRGMGATVVVVHFENSTKSKALNTAMQQIGDSYDLALILDADNTIESDFLVKLNNMFISDASIRIVQAHRCAKNTNTSMALLDAVSEEVNNTIFRQGHANIGLSAALIGSGMCFDYALFKKTMAGIDAVGGFDRALELTLLEQGYRIEYLPEAILLDEKIQRHTDFSRQRRRWVSAQVHYMRRFMSKIPEAVKSGNIDFCDKMFQQMCFPRLILLGMCFLLAVATLFLPHIGSLKWWITLALLIVTMLAATPPRLLTTKLFTAMIQLPYTFVLMVWGIVRIGGANKKFIHTSHGIDPGQKNKS